MNKKCIKGLVALTVLISIVVAWNIRKNSDANGNNGQLSIKTSSEAAHQAKIDKKIVKTYQPTREIAAITEKIGFTEKGRVIFYASNPQLLDAADFNAEVPDSYDTNATLGYYNHRKIFLYRIKNQDLEDIVEVTAAHEALHADWYRLTCQERRELMPLLEEDYAKIKTEKTEKLLADYAKFELGQRDNELHAFLGTEYHHLSPKLEKHYAKYFKNREKIVTMYENYQSKFDALEQKSTQLSAETTSLKEQIDSDLSQYETDLTNVNSEIDAFNSRSQNKAYASESEFIADRDSLQQKVSELTERQTQISSVVDQYNAKTDELNRIALKSSEFNKSINSKAIMPNQVPKAS